VFKGFFGKLLFRYLLRLKISLALSDEHDEKLSGYFEACVQTMNDTFENSRYDQTSKPLALNGDSL